MDIKHEEKKEKKNIRNAVLSQVAFDQLTSDPDPISSKSNFSSSLFS